MTLKQLCTQHLDDLARIEELTGDIEHLQAEIAALDELVKSEQLYRSFGVAAYTPAGGRNAGGLPADPVAVEAARHDREITQVLQTRRGVTRQLCEHRLMLAELQTRAGRFRAFLHRLTPLEQKIIRLRFGLETGGEKTTWPKVAEAVGKDEKTVRGYVDAIEQRYLQGHNNRPVDHHPENTRKIPGKLPAFSLVQQAGAS